MDFAKLVLKADSSDLKAATSNLKKTAHAASLTDGAVKKLNNSFNPKNLLGGLAAGVTITSIAGAIKRLSGTASDLSETISKNKQIFGSSAKQIEEWSKTASSSIGQSQRQAVDAADTFAIFGRGAGLAGQELVDFSKKFTVLASDLASFNNTSPEEAIVAIGAAMRGENEPIRRYGVLLDDATLKNQALRMGLIKTTKEALTPQIKTLAAAEQVFKQTTVAQGDFKRTSEGLANTERIANATLDDKAAIIGESLVPAMKQWYDLIIKISTVAAPLLDDTLKGWNFILGGESAANKTVADMQNVNKELADLIALRKEWNDQLEWSKKQFARTGAATYADDIKQAESNIQSITESIKGLNAETAGMFGNGAAKGVVPSSAAAGPVAEPSKNTFDTDVYDRHKEMLESIMTPAQELAAFEKELNDVYNLSSMTLYERNSILKSAHEEYLNSLSPLEAVIEAERLYSKQMAAGAITAEQYKNLLAERQSVFDEAAASEAEAMAGQIEREHEMLYGSLMTEEEEILASYERRREEILNAQTILEEQKTELMVKAAQDRDKKLGALRASAAKAEVSAYSQLFGSIATLGKTFAGEQSALYKGMFAVSKGFALAKAAINMGQALSESGSSAPWPANLALIAGAAATMGSIIADIAAVSFAGAKDKGGDIPAGMWGIAGEYGPEIISGPAHVTSRKETAGILGGRSNVKIVNVLDPGIVSQWAQSEDGEAVVMNIIRRNRAEIAEYSI